MEVELIWAPFIVVPTHVGMALHRGRGGGPEGGSPHARGDGPEMTREEVSLAIVVPTHVGMDRSA